MRMNRQDDLNVARLCQLLQRRGDGEQALTVVLAPMRGYQQHRQGWIERWQLRGRQPLQRQIGGQPGHGQPQCIDSGVADELDRRSGDALQA
jgi:hypothetical protein